MKKPFISIVIHTYNRASDLRFALFCILRQAYKNFEIVISDNCSTDETKQIVEALAKRYPQIKYYRNNKNIGPLPNLKNAISFASGDYVFLHSDDDFILETYALSKVAQIIKRYKPGYVRVNYFCRSPDKRFLFDFTVNKRFGRSVVHDRKLGPTESPRKVVEFLQSSDPYFVTGIVFKNLRSRGISMIMTEPCGWIRILLYNARTFGAYFMAKQLVVASWSEVRRTQDNYHNVFSVERGKLPAEGYIGEVGALLTSQQYKIYLRSRLTAHYVNFFPIIKLYTGNVNLLQVSRRIRELDPELAGTISYSVYLGVSWIVPGWVWSMVRSVYFFVFSRRSKIRNADVSAKTLSKLYESYYSGGFTNYR